MLKDFLVFLFLSLITTHSYKNVKRFPSFLIFVFDYYACL